MSHETIYLSLFVQGKGALRRELAQCLRTGRAYRRPKVKRAPSGKAKLSTGDDFRTSHRSRRPCSAGSLGRRPPNGTETDCHRQPGGTLVPVCDVVPPTRREHRKSRPRRSHRDRSTATRPSLAVTDLGSGAKKWPNTPSSASTPESTSTSVIGRALGSEEPTRTPTGCYVNTSPKAPT